MITLDTPVEEILSKPEIVVFMTRRGISPFSCAGAFPGTLGRLLEIKKAPDPEGLLEDLNREFDRL